MAIEVKVPALGESVTEATVGQWLKKPGDSVAVDEAIVSLETDKVAVDVPSPVAGVFGEQLVKEGDTVNVGTAIATVNEGGAGAAPAPATPAPAKAESAAPTPVAAASAAPESGGGNSVTLSPAVRRMVLEHGLDPSRIKGTGKDGRLTKDDVVAAIADGSAVVAAASAAAAAPTAVPASAAPARRQERVKMTRLRQTVAKRLKSAQETAALLTTFNDVDMSAVMEARAKYKDLFEKKHGVRLGFMGFFTKAVTHALKEIPAVNAEIDGTDRKSVV